MSAFLYSFFIVIYYLYTRYECAIICREVDIQLKVDKVDSARLIGV